MRYTTNNQKLNKMEYISCYKFFNQDGKRLSIFGRYLNETEVELFIIPCSLDEQFNRATARQIYKDYIQAVKTPKSAIVIRLQLLPEQSCMNILMKYACKTYFVKTDYKIMKTIELLQPAEYKPQYKKYA